MKTKRAIVFELNHLSIEQEIILGHFTYHAGRLWNQANYLVKNRLAKPDYRDLYNKLKDTSLHLCSLQSRCAQIVLDELSRGWNNFFKFLENPEKFKKKGIEIVRPPSYVNPETPHRVVTWDKTGFKIEGSRIRLSLSKSLKEHLLKKFGFSPDYLWIETGYKDLENLKVLNVQVVPYKSYGQVSFKLVVVYEKETPEVEPKGDKVLAIDYGVSNFATCVVEGNPISYIIDGRGLKTLLRKKLKKIVNLQSKLDNLKNKGLPTIALEKKLHRLWKSVKNLLRDFAHKVSSLIKRLAVLSRVKTVVIGKVQESKNKENDLPDLVNQMFKLLPHGKVTEYLTYKLKEVGIEVRLIDESYTSVADSCDSEAGVTKGSKGNGRRVKRGLFLSSVKGLINADVNGARNILRKFKKRWFDLVTGLKKVVKIRIYELSKGISESLLYVGIGVEGSVNLPGGIRVGITYQTPSEAPSYRAE
ncbi:transposase, IS605 OrfB family [Desulfurobacterium thermolithotrophum DSM 11699]|uniref:Transposase, IS605 OrfB family n=1 Tax=Desulfurobacterium thermolithotrophum (strain DSM 11699 / BSA) TaxID=868864 RepID=F0S3S5_DESTD|nr:RNA-guided endonuclease TnpB family protein [Desulfurobacterium thermolithotrophum]ADY73497.1 transposase, IS605 OrfB family [Desulfurobacterium thermolithotrophum DSM 11699]